MRVIRAIIVAFACLCFPCLALLPNSNVKIQPLPLAKGLDSDLSLISVTDNDGYLWIASDIGLKRYDGYSVKLFIHDEDDKNSTSIGSTSIRSMLFQDNQLWVGGVNLSLYHPEDESFSTYEVSDSDAIWVMYKQGDIIWLGGGGFGLRGFNTQSKEIVAQAFLDDDERLIFDIKPDNNSDNLWIASGTGVYLFAPTNNTAKRYLKMSDIGNQLIEEIAIDRDDFVWIGTRKGLFKLDTTSGALTAYLTSAANAKAKNLSTDTYWSLMVDRDGHVWAGTDKHGVNVYNPETDSFINIPSSLLSTKKHKFPALAIFHIHQDPQGTYWFSTSQGVYTASPNLQRFHTIQNIPGEPNSLIFDNVLTLHEDKEGIIWIATDGGGLDAYNPITDSFTHYVHDPLDKNSLSGNSVIAIDEDREGNLWVGTYNAGLNKFNKKTQQFTRFQHKSGLSESQTIINNDIFKIFIDDKQRVWMSIWREGFQIYDPTQDRFYSYTPKGSDENIYKNFLVVDIEHKRHNEYWIASYAGIGKFDIEKEIFVNVAIPKVERVLDVYPVDEHSAWLATNNGLVLYNDQTKEVINYTEQDGLIDNYLVSIEQDRGGIFWLGARKGLSRFNPVTKTFKNYTESDGLVSDEFNRFSHLHTRDGLMYFGGPNGISVFDPKNMPNNDAVPNVVITKLEVKNKNEEQVNLLPSWHTEQALTLAYDHNDVFFEFSALNFYAPNKNAYKYRLIGLEAQWNSVDAADRKARYTNLSPGNYQFEIIAANNEGVWNREGKKVRFTILPPWWLTWWAWGCYIVLAFAVMYLFSYWRTRINKQRAQELEQEVEQRTEELKATVTKLTQTQTQLVESEKMASLGDMVAGIAHEVNTPLGICLTSISHLKARSDDVFDKFKTGKLAKNDFQIFQQDVELGLSLSLSNINRAAELIRSFKQVAVEQSSEQIHRFILNTLLQDSIQTVSPRLKKAHVQIAIDCDENIEMRSCPGAISQIIINFVMNSLTHGLQGRTDGAIKIEAVEQQDIVRITYTDNGKGIPKENMNKIFEPFFTTNRQHGNTGLGMHIVYNLVSQTLDGTIHVNKPERGVEFIIEIPICIQNEKINDKPRK